MLTRKRLGYRQTVTIAHLKNIRTDKRADPKRLALLPLQAFRLVMVLDSVDHVARALDI